MNCVILVGMPGCGKSKCAEILCREENASMINSDEIIENSAKSSISEIFNFNGEDYFRNLELTLINSLANQLKKPSPDKFQKNDSIDSRIQIQISEILDSTYSDQKKLLILDTGGGLPTYNGLMKRLKTLGLVIFLSCKPETLVDRLKVDHTRPLLNSSVDDYEPIKGKFEKMVKLLRDRERCYKEAHVTVDTDDMEILGITKSIQTYINKWKCSEDFPKTV